MDRQTRLYLSLLTYKTTLDVFRNVRIRRALEGFCSIRGGCGWALSVTWSHILFTESGLEEERKRGEWDREGFWVGVQGGETSMRLLELCDEDVEATRSTENQG